MIDSPAYFIISNAGQGNAGLIATIGLPVQSVLDWGSQTNRSPPVWANPKSIMSTLFPPRSSVSRPLAGIRISGVMRLNLFNATISTKILDHKCLVICQMLTDISTGILMLNNTRRGRQMHIAIRMITMRTRIEGK